MRRLSIIGMFVKRRCNLRLTEQETGAVAAEDIALSLNDMANVLSDAGIESSMQWQGRAFSPEFSLFVFDTLEYLLEYENFSVRSVHIRTLDTGEVLLCLRAGREAPLPPAEGLEALNTQNYKISWLTLSDGYRLTLAERDQEK